MLLLVNQKFIELEKNIPPRSDATSNFFVLNGGSGSSSGGGSGSFLAWQDLGRMFDHSFLACVLVVFFFFKVEIILHTLIPFFICQDQSTVAQ